MTEESEVKARWAGYLHAVMCSVWSMGIIPTDWKRGLVVPLWKGKGDRQDCTNY